MISRRSFLTGLGATLAAPAVIRIPGLLMPIRTIVPVWTHQDYALGYAITDEELIVSQYLTDQQAWFIKSITQSKINIAARILQEMRT